MHPYSWNSPAHRFVTIGLAAPAPQEPQTIPKGVYEYALEWDGKNWTGPSDVSMPKGEPFPPGEYTLTVSVIGEQQTAKGLKKYDISADITVTLKK